MIRMCHHLSLGLSPWAAFPGKLSPLHAAGFVFGINKDSGIKSSWAGPAPRAHPHLATMQGSHG